MKVVINDGGRTAAGYKGTAGDCACRAVSIATGRDYQEVYESLNFWASKERSGSRKRGKSHARTGIHHATMRKYMEAIGWQWVPTMGIGTGCKVHLKADELPTGRLVVSLSRHYAAVIDGVLHDNHDSSRDETRCVYGYWQIPD